MKTEVAKVNPKKPEDAIIKRAAGIIRNGGVVAFPTETVYGLGADAFNPSAVRKIFSAKGRPADDPLIVHIGKFRDVEEVAIRITPLEKRLMRKFWPGPLTLVLPKAKRVPRAVTAGLPTVAVRMPSHPIARALCRFGPIAAPSANTFGRPSPTMAKHVYADLRGKIPMILDGGRTKVGIESTIVSVSPPKLLRPGKITAEQLRRYLPALEIVTKTAGKPLAPGMKYKHYAPRTPLWLVEKPTEMKMRNIVERERRKGRRIGLLCSGGHRANADKIIILGKSPEDAARGLFDALRRLDQQKLDLIIAEGWPEKGFGRAVMNRLRRAATRVI